MDDVTLARAIHILAVIHWIGGVAFVTAVILPYVAAAEPERRLDLFDAVESRFAAQVRLSVPVAGLSGFYMADRLDVWDRFLQPTGWWLSAMVLVWLLFMAVLFVVEPLVLRAWFRRRVMADPDGTFRLMQRAHWGLLSAGAATAAAGVLGAHALLG